MTLLHRGYKWGCLNHKGERVEGQRACYRLLLQQKMRCFPLELGAIGPALGVSMYFQTPGEMGIGVGASAGELSV